MARRATNSWLTFARYVNQCIGVDLRMQSEHCNRTRGENKFLDRRSSYDGMKGSVRYEKKYPWRADQWVQPISWCQWLYTWAFLFSMSADNGNGGDLEASLCGMQRTSWASWSQYLSKSNGTNVLKEHPLIISLPFSGPVVRGRAMVHSKPMYI